MLAPAPLVSHRPAPPADFTDRAIAALLSCGGELATSRRSLPTGRLRWFIERRPTGSLVVEVVESPHGSERDAMEPAATLLRARGFRARVFAGGSRLLVCAERGSR